MGPGRFVRVLLALIALGWPVARADAQSSTYPSRPITIVSPFAAGGINDITSRLVAERLMVWKQPVIVENRTGANGSVGATAVARAPGDGHTLLMANGATHGTNSALYPNLPYHPVRDFKAVGMVLSSPILIVVNADSPFSSVADLVAHAKAHPGEVSWGTSGNGSTGHIVGEVFKKRGGFNALHIAYRGDAPAVTDVLAKTLTAALISYGSVLGLVESGRVKVLAKATDPGSTILPGVPSMIEAGFPDFRFSTWYGLVAPAATPDAVVEKIGAEIQAMLADGAVVARIASLGAEPRSATPKETADFVNEEVRRLGGLVREFGLEAN